MAECLNSRCQVSLLAEVIQLPSTICICCCIAILLLLLLNLFVLIELIVTRFVCLLLLQLLAPS
jgi:hypothetical protein